MSHQAMVAQASIDRILALVPIGFSATEYLTSLLDATMESEQSGPTAMGVVMQTGVTNVFASARRTAENIDNVELVCSRPEGIVDLGVIEWLLRPALLLRDGLITPLAEGPWRKLTGDLTRNIAHSVCRINVSISGFAPIHLGTGFVIGRDRRNLDVVVTNAHVVEFAQSRFLWRRIPEVKIEADFGCEVEPIARSEPIELSTTVSVHQKHDLAVLTIDERYDGQQRAVLAMAATPPNANDIQIGVIGHPSFDSNIDPFPRIFGFGDAFGVKRFSPGLIRAVAVRKWRSSSVHALLHDASTLSGSSGSCVFDLATLSVCGLHFGGWPRAVSQEGEGDDQSLAQLFEANGAVPLWQLKDDPIFGEINATWL
jgi:hypothetical protein